jgi:hypothetical protein
MRGEQHRGGAAWPRPSSIPPRAPSWRPRPSAACCRNCLSRWYREAAEAKGIALADPDAREIIYGMPYKEWQARYQKEASPEQKAAFAKAHPGH